MLAKQKIKRYMGFVSLVVVFVVILSIEARAELYGFAPISDNSGVSGWMAQQLSLEVTDYGTTSEGVNQVLFDFRNNIAPYAVGSPIDGIIGSLFFEDGVVLGIAKVLDADYSAVLYPGVYFKTSANPASKTFPAGGTLVPPFQTTAHFWSTNDGTIANGVNPGEKVGIVFDLEEGEFFADVISAIGLGFTNPNPGGNTSLRIGVHVQNLPDDYEESDSFILVPIPASVVLGILGLGVVGLKLRKFA